MEGKTDSSTPEETKGGKRITLHQLSKKDAQTAEPGDVEKPMSCCRCGICNDKFASRNEVYEHIKSKHYRWSLENQEDDWECPISDLIEISAASSKTSVFLPDFDHIDKFLKLSSSVALSSKGDYVHKNKIFNDANNTSRTVNVTKLSADTDIRLTSDCHDGACGLSYSNFDVKCVGIALDNAQTTAISGGTLEKDGCRTSSAISSRNEDKGHQLHPDYSTSIRNDIRYLCELCRSKFVSFGTCSLHMRTVHGRTPLLPVALQDFTMKQIEQVFLKDISHKVSDKCSMNGPKLIFICSLCGGQFSSLQHCNRHLKEEHLPQSSRRTAAKGMKRDEQMDVSSLGESALNGIPKVQQVKKEEHDREITLDLLLKLTQLILARYESDEQTDDGDDSDKSGQETSDGMVGGADRSCLIDQYFEDQEDFEALDVPVSSGRKPEQMLNKDGELSKEQMVLTYHCFVCAEQFTSFKDCGRHMISKHPEDGDRWGEVLGLHQMTLGQFKKMYQVTNHLEQPTDRRLSGEPTPERRQEGITSDGEEVSEQLGDGGATSLEQPSPKKMKHFQRNIKLEDTKAGILKQKLIQSEGKAQEVKQKPTVQSKRDQICMDEPSSFRCSECSANFKSALGLDKHVGGTHCGVSSLKCQKCAKYASTPAEEKYTSIMEEITAVKEDILRRGFKKKGGSEKIEHYFECVVCGDGFRYRVHFDKHLSCHVEYICRMCHQDFPSFTALSMHVHSHNCGPLPCKDCGKTFYNTNSWLDHVLRHQKQLQCDLCHIPISNLQNLRRHKITKHHIGKKDSFKCNECGKKFHFKYKYLLHIQNVHTSYDPENNSNYLCDHCGVKLKSANYLRLHVLTHQDVFTCEQCGCWFKQQSQLDLHKNRAHQNSALIDPENLALSQPVDNIDLDTNITEIESVLKQQKEAKHQRKRKPNSCLTYKCGYCKTYFRSMKLKIRHEKRHIEAEFQCGKCDNLLPSYEDYKKHLRNHHEFSEQLFYKCSVCPKRFQAPWQLERHSKKHCTCKTCGQTFEKFDLLIEHLKTHDHNVDQLSAGKSSKHTTQSHQSNPYVPKRSKDLRDGSPSASLDASAALITSALENVPSKVSLNVFTMEGIEMSKSLSYDEGATDLLMSLSDFLDS